MDRRRFIAYGSTAALGAGALSALWTTPAKAAAVSLTLTMHEANVQLVDGSTVFMWAYSGGTDAPRVPGPVIRVKVGDTVTLNVVNSTATTHGFSIPGISGTAIASLAPGANATVVFSPTAAGTYFYLDPMNAPVNRVLGLHGAFVVSPTNGLTSNGKPMPYTVAQKTTQIDSLFSTLGTGVFPGNAWDPATRDMVWLFNSIDPRFNAQAATGATINPATMISTFLPRYFTLNGLSGFFSSHDANTAPEGRVGQPTLLRTMNAGLATHSPHIHGNHIYELSGINPSTGAVVVNANLLQRDTWTVGALDRKDVLLPFKRPPDAPVWPPVQEAFPLFYPMHCHMEMSQTAGGGSYPQGLVTDWVLTGL